MSLEKQSRELTLTMPWGHVSAKAWGSHEDKAVLLVHGTLDNAGSFTRLVQLLPDNYYYVAIDLPGHGFSTHFPSGISLDFFNYVLTIKYVLDQLRWDKCMYVGHSFGAQLGIMFSIIYPNRLTKIATLDGLLPKAVDDYDLLTRIRQVNDTVLFELNKNEPRLYTKNEVLDALQNRRTFKLNEAAAQALFERSVTIVGDKCKYNRDLRMRPFIYPSFNFAQYSELAKHISAPVLVILASNSWYNFTPETSLSLLDYKKILPNTCTFVNVEGNHDVHNNNPERVAPYIHTFLKNDTKSISLSRPLFLDAPSDGSVRVCTLQLAYDIANLKVSNRHIIVIMIKLFE